MKEWYKKRCQYSHENLLKDLRLSEPNDFKNFLRMDADTFDDLLRIVSPMITKTSTAMREPISPKERLSVTLRYLATGNTLKDLKFISAISPQSISCIVLETCEVLIHFLKNYIKLPNTPNEWIKIADGFEKRWNFPHCLGAIDGKHIAIKKPPNTGSFYYNYKNFFSIVMMAVVGPQYEFLMVDVGINGRISDGGVISYTTFGQKLDNNSLGLPEPGRLPDSPRTLPFVFVADDAFAMSENLLKPYPQTELIQQRRIFNYRLSRARRIVENAFDILAARFGVFQRPILLSSEKTRIVVLACWHLHNYLRRNISSTYLSQGSADIENLETGAIINGSWRSNEELVNLQNSYSRNLSDRAKHIRYSYCEYFNNEGKVLWQHNFI